MSRASLLILLILGTVGSQAKIVHQVAPNQFELELEERGTRLTQKIRFDPDGLRITEVPAHHDLVHAIYVFDSSTVCTKLLSNTLLIDFCTVQLYKMFLYMYFLLGFGNDRSQFNKVVSTSNSHLLQPE